MSRIYNTQTKLTIEIDSESSLDGVVLAIIKFKQPNKILGEWIGEIDVPEDNVVSYTIPEDEPLIAGTWTMWLHLTFEDGRVLIGEAFKFKVYKEGIAI